VVSTGSVKEIGVILLAAGQGTRMKSDLPKVLHSLGGKPLFLHALGTARQLKPARVAVVVGHGGEAVRQACTGEDVIWVVQEKQLGTGHAVRCAEAIFHNFSGSVVILSGDVPLISEHTLRVMIAQHYNQDAALTLLTADLAVPRGYGRILKDGRGEITGVVEEKDATEVQKEITEVNAGAYVASPQFLFTALASVSNRNQQGEYYLPDVVSVGLDQGQKVASVKVEDAREILGVNTREELAYYAQGPADHLH
jgi:bifunctional UDP-N-acetylglucosamine pyrophosphorylase/glucosamine-1-phosphate N-acetyltransferase